MTFFIADTVSRILFSCSICTSSSFIGKIILLRSDSCSVCLITVANTWQTQGNGMKVRKCIFEIATLVSHKKQFFIKTSKEIPTLEHKFTKHSLMFSPVLDCTGNWCTVKTRENICESLTKCTVIIGESRIFFRGGLKDKFILMCTDCIAVKTQLLR